jgi:pimeloyl-ACP methyl ester carboxylesterase
VDVKYYAVRRPDAVATLVMFSGGGGGYGTPDETTGWTNSNNFVIRTAPQFAAMGPFNVVLMGRASDTPSLDYSERASPQHQHDNLAVVRAVKKKSALPIWLVSTSRGTISAAQTTIGDSERLVSGLVLTSSVTDGRKRGAIPLLDLERVRVPTLVVHHRNDACKATQPNGVASIMRGLRSAPVKQSVIVSGGEDRAEGDPCAGLHNHGFHGIEDVVVPLIANWILKPTSGE